MPVKAEQQACQQFLPFGKGLGAEQSAAAVHLVKDDWRLRGGLLPASDNGVRLSFEGLTNRIVENRFERVDHCLLFWSVIEISQ